MINAWLLCAAFWLPSATAVPATAKASNEEQLRTVVQTGTPHITITADFSTSGGLVLSKKEIQSLRGTCHLQSPGADWCTLELGDTIQIDHDLWLDGLNIKSPKAGSPSLQVSKLYTQLWMTNVSMSGNGSPNAAGIELNGHLFAENCTFSQLKSQSPGRGAAVHLGSSAASATLHRCTLKGNNLLDTEPAASAVHVMPGGGVILSESNFSHCTLSAGDTSAAEDMVARNALQPCVATLQPAAGQAAIDATQEAQVFSKTPLQYAVYGEDQQILRWMEAEMAWDPEPGEEGRFLRGQERKYSDVRQAAVNASARQQEEQLGEGDGAETRVSALQPPGRSPGRASSASPSGTLIAALVGSVVVLVILAAATVVALLLLQRHRKRAGDGGQRRGLRGIDAAAPVGRENGHIGGGDNSAYAMQAQYGAASPALHGNGSHTVADKTATFTASGVYMPPGHAYGSEAQPGLQAQHGGQYGPPPPGAIGARTGPLFSTPHPAALAAGATAPVGYPGVGVPAPPHALPPPGVTGNRGGAGNSVSVLTAANLSLLEQSIPAAAQANPFSNPPAVRSMLSVEQGLQDALDSLIISGRPLMGRYTLDASTVREITPKSIVQFASEVPEAARPVAVKFFVSRPNFEREEAVLGNDALQAGFDRDSLRIESNFDGSFRAPNGYIYPPCIVMPRGEGLRTWVDTRDPKLLEVAQMLMHVGRRLASVHRGGWTHRNLHPGNVLQRLGEPGNWMITDWNSAAKIGTFPPLVDGLRHCPPEDISAVEQGQVATKATAAADVWALGLIAFETLTKTVVFPAGTTEKQIRDRITGRLPLPWEEGDAAGRERVRALRGFRRSVMMCLERNPARRPRSTEIVTMWTHLFDGPPTNTEHEPSDSLPPAAQTAQTGTVTAEGPAATATVAPRPGDVHISAMPSL